MSLPVVSTFCVVLSVVSAAPGAPVLLVFATGATSVSPTSSRRSGAVLAVAAAPVRARSSFAVGYGGG